MEITSLIENTINQNKQNLCKEHGLSLYIETIDKKILFDTGATGRFINNAKQLGVDLKDIDMVIISHGHYDHTGGLLTFLSISDKATVYLKRSSDKELYYKLLGFKKYIGIDKRVIENYSNRVTFIDEFTEISNGVFIITDINKSCPLQKGNKHLFIKEGNVYKNDDFNHELILVVKENDELIIFTGCSHSGIVNMVSSVNKVFDDSNIKAVVGGFHLMGIRAINLMTASKEEVKKIAEYIQDCNVGKVYTGHCTGEKAYKELKYVLKDRLDYISTGSKVNI